MIKLPKNPIFNITFVIIWYIKNYLDSFIFIIIYNEHISQYIFFVISIKFILCLL